METISKSIDYTESLTHYRRLVTREVNIGHVPLGANHPIRVQSMTTTDTMDTLATVEQSIRMIEAGCEYVRITAPSINEARNLEVIKKELKLRGYSTPLIADIHFTPNAAELAARIVEKVRVNPGNYADKKKFEVLEYTDHTYDEELERIRQRFTPLVKICKEYGTAMRIGTNHGSLSDRILSRYGDTPLGMVESALEFLRICEDLNYHNIVLSMKASNPRVMVQAYRLLIVKMKEAGMNYPLHLGVTEAGEGEDGRIKSAAGIGTLLEDGIGDTIRVSLTEDPEFEIPVAKELVNRYAGRASHQPIADLTPNARLSWSPFEYSRRPSREVLQTGGNKVPVVVADYSHKQVITPASLFPLGYNYSAALDKWNLTDQACDFLFCGNNQINFEVPGTLGLIFEQSVWNKKEHTYPLFSASAYLNANDRSSVINFVEADASLLFESNNTLSAIGNQFLSSIKNDATAVLVLATSNLHGMAEQRRVMIELMNREINVPVIIKRSYSNIGSDTFRLYAATDAGALLLDGFGDGIWLHAPGIVSEQVINSTAFGILQASRTRISKTEYISCPSCGRTLFDLQETTAKIRARTDHLKGVKIGIMGCIVNGPGEMADADYGYVGVGAGKITLYKGKEVVRRSIDSERAVDALIELIKEHGDWVEKLD
ncbi:MAG TPA: (E)-4-hydroxy-3-methylbut-2-enyl-diphosphate synthase [Bacteroidia bacterium]|nr:(E)-4-hydroxy-3-methylbut-2-enyl-diphosphate synthase [Bacteroidia bacterium]